MMVLRRLSRMTLPVFCFLAAWLNAFAAEVAYVAKTFEQSSTRQQMEIAAKFYGLEADVTVLTGIGDDDAIVKVIRKPKTVAIAIAADALPSLNQKHDLAAIQKQGRRIPLLIVGITEQTSPALLRQWSAGAITGCKKSAVEQGAGWYTVASANDITRQLGVTKLPLNQEEVSYLTLDNGRGGQWLMAASLGAVTMPVFAKVVISGQEVFFATAAQAANIPVTPDPYRQPAVFATL